MRYLDGTAPKTIAQQMEFSHTKQQYQKENFEIFLYYPKRTLPQQKQKDAEQKEYLLGILNRSSKEETL